MKIHNITTGSQRDRLIKVRIIINMLKERFSPVYYLQENFTVEGEFGFMQRKAHVQTVYWNQESKLYDLAS